MKIVQTLKQKNLKISTAESFTGGSIAKAIISESGASDVFYEGIVCYNTQVKIDKLSVKKETIDTYSVVSEEVAREMVVGLIKNSSCDISVATTGYAEIQGKDYGYGYIAVGDKNNIKVEKKQFFGNRQTVIEKATEFALNMIINFINERD